MAFETRNQDQRFATSIYENLRRPLWKGRTGEERTRGRRPSLLRSGGKEIQRKERPNEGPTECSPKGRKEIIAKFAQTQQGSSFQKLVQHRAWKG